MEKESAHIISNEVSSTLQEKASPKTYFVGWLVGWYIFIRRRLPGKKRKEEEKENIKKKAPHETSLRCHVEYEPTINHEGLFRRLLPRSIPSHRILPHHITSPSSTRYLPNLMYPPLSKPVNRKYLSHQGTSYVPIYPVGRYEVLVLKMLRG